MLPAFHQEAWRLEDHAQAVIDVAEQVEWLNRDIRPLETALKERPEVLAIIRVRVAIDVGHGMVNHLLDA
jgi:hypothetical protein